MSNVFEIQIQNTCIVFQIRISNTCISNTTQHCLWMAFVDLEKAFDRVPREVVWWALRELWVAEWIVCVIKAMYDKSTTVAKHNGNEG